jgi:Fic family protein
VLKRPSTGTTVAVETQGEQVRAFIPKPLPPAPPLDIDAGLGQRLDQAMLALGRLDSITTILPDPNVFLYTYVRREAVLSSQIEGTQSSLSDLLMFELDDAPGVPFDDVVEVSNYVAALEHGLARVRGGFPISSRLIRELHRKLLARGRGAHKLPGEFRRSQVWLGGTRPGNAHFVPPPHPEVAPCMSALEQFIHDESNRMSPLVKAALTHVQFETIHPFLDGNGRVGRLLIALQLSAARVLHEPLLYLSLYFKQHRSEYYRQLNVVRTEGDWEAWLTFFLEAVVVSAESAVDTARKLSELFRNDREMLGALGKISGSVLRVHYEMQRRPVATAGWLARATGLSIPTVGAALRALEARSVVREITGRKRNRVFAYDQYVKLLSDGPLR